jgi:hypothetical protein
MHLCVLRCILPLVDANVVGSKIYIYVRNFALLHFQEIETHCIDLLTSMRN